MIVKPHCTTDTANGGRKTTVRQTTSLFTFSLNNTQTQVVLGNEGEHPATIAILNLHLTQTFFSNSLVV